ncbi:RHS repeat-associated core domain-containing protein [bacterium]|nr:MAG: RHS repeat-associated core domain-containing protein [bacterium]
MGQLVDGGDGSIAARYEYDAFGGAVVAEGAMVNDNPYRFSTKYLDETGMYYYGNRYYLSDLGRWNRLDPMEDGLNWYGFVGNGSINATDYLGLKIRAGCIDNFMQKYLTGFERDEDGDYIRGWGNHGMGGNIESNAAEVAFILQRMMASKSIFKIAGNSTDEFESNLRKHIYARFEAVQRTINFKPGLSEETIWHHSIPEVDNSTEDMELFYKSVNNEESSMGCATAAVLILSSAMNEKMKPSNFALRAVDSFEGTLIPGDWAFLVNLSAVKELTEEGIKWNLETWKDTRLHGINLIMASSVLGEDEFWTHTGEYTPNNIRRGSISGYKNAVSSWKSSDGKQNGVPVELLTTIRFPVVGLDLEGSSFYNSPGFPFK